MELFLHPLEPLVGLPDVAGAERGQVDLGGEQMPQVLLVRLEGQRLGQTDLADHLLRLPAVEAAQQVAGLLQVRELHLQAQLPHRLDPGVVLGVVSLRHDSPNAADLAVSLAALKDWTFLFGPGLVVPFGNGLILGYLMYTSGLVPRRMAWLGLIGGPLLLIGNIGALFDWWEQTGPVGLLVAPEFLWELLLGIYAAIWGFRRAAPILSAGER